MNKWIPYVGIVIAFIGTWRTARFWYQHQPVRHEVLLPNHAEQAAVAQDITTQIQQRISATYSDTLKASGAYGQWNVHVVAELSLDGAGLPPLDSYTSVVRVLS